jgi:endonuclease YncB( thermonuclease family)
LIPGLVGLALAAGCQAPAPPPGASPSVVPAAPEQALLSQVVDGDTVVTGDGRTVRVLGIDACDLGTPAGDRARDEAVALLASAGSTAGRRPAW